MSLRVVTVPLFDTDADEIALGAGFDIARRFEAHLVGLFVRADPQDAVPLIGGGVSQRVMDELIRATAAETDRRRDGAKARFETARTAAKVPVADAPPGPGTVTARWREVTGRRERVIPEAARLADLTVFGRAGGEGEPHPELRAAFEATLLGCGRPLLLVPPGAPEHIGHNLAVAWNGSAEAAAALAGAMPFLERAVNVHLLTAETRRVPADVSIGVAEYLEWHGVPYERRPVEIKGGESEGVALLRAAGEVGADLLVMGGYGRTRLSEMILGGVTRHVLTHAHVPVLMAH